MNLEHLQKTLLAAARRDTPSDRVPYAFEQRVMAHVRALRPTDRVSAWTAVFWRAALSSVAIALLLVGANVALPDAGGDDADGLTAGHLEVAVAASGNSTW